MVELSADQTVGTGGLKAICEACFCLLYDSSLAAHGGHRKAVSLSALVASFWPRLAQSWWSSCCGFSVVMTFLQGTPVAHLLTPGHSW